MNEILRIRDLVVRFHTDEGVVQALNGINLDIGRKETVGLVGETGCGKTMTAFSILRLVPPPGKIEGGSILFDAGDGNIKDILSISEKEIRKLRGNSISMVFQEPFTAACRLRGNRQVTADSLSFRVHVKQLLGDADRESRRLGYSGQDVKLAVYAFVVFLDECVLNSSMSAFSDWAFPRS